MSCTAQAAQEKFWVWKWWEYQLRLHPPPEVLQAAAHCKSHLFSPASFHWAGTQRDIRHSRTAFANTRSLALFLCRSIYSLKWCCKAKGQMVNSFKEQVPKDPTWDPRTHMSPGSVQEITADTADPEEGNFVLWRSWHPSTTLTSTFIRKAKWGIINSLLHKCGLLWKDSNYCLLRGISPRKQEAAVKVGWQIPLGNTKKAARIDPPQHCKRAAAAAPGPFQPALFSLQGQLQHLRDPPNRQIRFTLFHITRHTWKTESPCWPTASSGLTAPTAQLCTINIKSCISWEPNYHLQNSFAIRLKL